MPGVDRQDFPQEGQSERRRDPRRRVVKGAQILFNDGHCTMDCHILDITETGALLMPRHAMSCPKTFILKPRIGPEHQCEVIWRRATKIGVRFL
jgi:hypothetical protein